MYQSLCPSWAEETDTWDHEKNRMTQTEISMSSQTNVEKQINTQKDRTENPTKVVINPFSIFNFLWATSRFLSSFYPIVPSGNLT